jgi:hypothetical protein
MGADGVTIGKDAPHQVGMPPGSLPGQEKSRRYLESVKYVEEFRSERGIGPVVKGERHSPFRGIKRMANASDMDDGGRPGASEAGFGVLSTRPTHARAIHGLPGYSTSDARLPGDTEVSE